VKSIVISRQAANGHLCQSKTRLISDTPTLIFKKSTQRLMHAVIAEGTKPHQACAFKDRSSHLNNLQLASLWQNLAEQQLAFVETNFWPA
jgi:hypothetical protein